MAKQGKVKWFSNSKGYGFIEQPDGADAFVHYSDIVSDERYKTLVEGEAVQYELEQGEKGPKATNVVRLDPPASPQPPQPTA